MIHLLRRVRRKLITKGRISRYLFYALGEILLVVVGILIALQINNWNEHRKQKNSEYAILVDLYKEFQFNHTNFKKHLSDKIDIKRRFETLIEAIADPHSASPLKSKARGSSGAKTYNPSQSTIQSVIETGGINIISNDSLRYLLNNWSDLLSDFTEDEEWHINFLQNVMYNYETRHMPNHYFKTSPADGFISPFHNAEELQEQFKTAYEDPEYQNLLLRNHQYLDGVILDGSRALAMMESIISLLDNEIKKRRS